MSLATIRLRGVAQPVEAEIDTAADVVLWRGSRHPASRLPLDIPAVGTVYGALLNFRGALAALGDAVHHPPYQAPPKAPILYIKPRNTHIASGVPIPLPDGIDTLSVGAALGVVIARDARRVRVSDAPACIAGFTIANDVSIPHDSLYRPPVAQKCRDGFCPIGPWVVHRDSVPDPDALGIRVFVNGALVQTASTADLVRPIVQLLANVTEFMTLRAGDVLLVGVPHGQPRVRAGDRVRIEIDHVGALENPVVPEALWWTEVIR